MEQKYYTVGEVAEIFGCSKATVTRKIKKGIIPTHPAFDEKSIPKDFVDNWEETTESFAERRLREQLEAKEREIHQLKKLMREITKISLEVEK